jgi:hypothetical protein
MPHPPRPRSSFELGVAALVTVVVALAVWPSPVGAHSDDGVMTVLTAEQAGPGAVRLEVGLVYANDDDLAEEATVGATLTGPDGASVGPVELPRISGARYGADVEVPGPGDWSVAFVSEEPVAEAAATVEVADTGQGAPAPTQESAQPEIVPRDPPPPVPTAGDDDGFPWVVAIAVVVIAAVVVATLTFLRRRSRAG